MKMMDLPVLTIVIPTFNSGKTLERALDSILDQRFAGWEIQIIDGLSTDNTLDIINNYTLKDNRIHFVSEKDAGIYDAMNKGIRRASGQWLYFLGSDDRLHDETVLEKVHAEIIKGNDLLIYGYIISEKYGRYGGRVTADDLLKNNISHQAMFFHKKIFEELGFYDTGYKTHADWDFNLRCFNHYQHGIKYLDLPIAEYATGGASSVHEARFLREVILPARLNQLTREKQTYFLSVSRFDEWWRFIRNAKIKSEADLLPYSRNGKAPFTLLLMIRAQKNLSEAALTNGIKSKFFMGITYLRYLFFKILN
jgi:glycosyltransferase involved in cell wall biosynthesis